MNLFVDDILRSPYKETEVGGAFSSVGVERFGLLGDMLGDEREGGSIYVTRSQRTHRLVAESAMGEKWGPLLLFY